MRVVKWLLGGLAVLVLAVLVAALTLPLWFDPNDHKAAITERVEAATGRAFAIEGDIELAFFPWLALSAGPVSLGNDPAFTGDEFFRARRAAAELRVLPLILSGQIEVGTVRVEGPEIHLEVNAQGRGNWESLTGGVPAPDEAPPEPGGELVGLTIEAIVVNDGIVSYTDRAAGITARLSGLGLSATPIRADTPIEADLRTDYEFADYRGRLEARLVATNALTEQALVAELSQLRFTNTVAPPVTVTIERPAVLDLGGGTLNLPEFEISSLDANGHGSLEGRGLPAEPVFEGRLELDEFNLGDWLAETGLYTAQTTDPEALDTFSAQLEWKMAGDVIDIPGLEGQLDSSRIAGRATLAETIEFALEVDALNADRYLPPESGPDEPDEEAGGETELAFGKLRGSLSIGEFVLAGLTATNVRVTVESDESGLRILPIEGDLYGGSLNARLELDTQTGALTAAAEVQQVRGGDLLGSWMSPAPLSGIGDLTADLALGRPFDADPLTSANGTVSFDFTDGAIYGVNIMKVLRQVLAATGRGSESDLQSGDRETDFSSLRVDGSIERGILTTRKFELLAPYLRVNGSGSINLASGGLDYQIVPTLVETPEGQGSKGLGSLAGTPIPLKVGGSMADPEVSFDVKQILLSSQGSKLEDKLLEKLGGSKDEEGDESEGEGKSSKDLLKSLLEGALKDDRQGEEDTDDDGSL